MVSASKAARDAKKAAAGKGPKISKEDKAAEAMKKMDLQEDKDGISDRVTTGVLSSLEASKDVKITSASLVFHGKVLFNDTNLEVSYGRRYGLLGENGCGKSTLLKAIAAREYPFPEHIDIYLLNEGAEKSSTGALEWVVKQAEKALADMEQQAETILEEEGPNSPKLEDLYERIDAMDPSTFHTRASLILTGLGFNKKTMDKKTKDMSGGWRMRVALAKALFVKPALLLLESPLDQEAADTLVAPLRALLEPALAAGAAAIWVTRSRAAWEDPSFPATLRLRLEAEEGLVPA